MSLSWNRGTLSLVGSRIDAIANTAFSQFSQTTFVEHFAPLHNPSSQFHLTVCTKEELRDSRVKEALPSLDTIDTDRLYVIGVAGSVKLGVFFVVVVWVAGQALRKRIGLRSKQFHITLTDRDDHTLNKGFDAVLPPNYSPDIPWTDPEFLDHLAFTLHLENKFDRAREIASRLCSTNPNSERGFLRLGDAALKGGKHKLAMLAYACAFERCADSKVFEYCLKRVEECSQFTEWGGVFMDAELNQLTHDVPPELLTPWSATLREELSRRELITSPTLCVQSREHMLVPSSTTPTPRDPYFCLPRFFRWLVPFHLALMSTPRNADDIDALATPYLGIRYVLTLTEESPLDPSWFARPSIQNTFMPIPNYHPPTIEQMDLVLRMIEDERNVPILIHCGGGKGRAGTVAACYLVAHGFARPDPSRIEPAMSAKDAIAALRALRPGSLETAQQEEFVAKYCSAIWKRHAILPELVPEPPPCPFEIEGTLPDNADLFMLVGLPGSGKSTFSRSLIARNPRSWTHICQDDAGSRSACETAIGNVRAGRGARVLLDCCNVTRAGRAEWLALAAHWATTPVCVWFDYGRELCTSRAQNRPGHPTLPPGNRVRNAMDQMAGAFERPSTSEGFATVCVVRSFKAAEELVARLSPPVGLFKFPRTPHLLDLGSATSDDLISTAPLSLDADARVVVTEKVDGANMGFLLSADRAQIAVQNRSHYVNRDSHEQFRKLGLWMERHREGLMLILDRDPVFAQRYVLFGEWLVATHAISYSRLPDWFLAFDLYDRSFDRWADRRTLETLLEGTGIGLVPVVHAGRMLSNEELTRAVQQPSMFYEGRVEGVYVKVEKAGRVLSRGKVVRPDFITGNEHWTKGPLRLNTLEHGQPP